MPGMIDRDQEDLMRELRKRALGQMNQTANAGGYMGGPTAGQFGMMSQTLPTANEQQAFTNRKIAREQWGQYGRGGVEREKIAAESGTKREGFRSAEKVAGITAGASRDVAGINAGASRDVAGIQGATSRDVAGIQGATSRDVAGIEARTNLNVADKEAATKQQELGMRYGPEGVDRITATKPQYHYADVKDSTGAVIGHQAYKDGQPITQPPGQMDWAKAVKKEQFPQAVQVVQSMTKGKSPEEMDSFVDDVFKMNPELGAYLRKNPKQAANPTQQATVQAQTTPGESANQSIGQFLDAGTQRYLGTFMRNMNAPYSLARGILGARVPKWMELK